MNQTKFKKKLSEAADPEWWKTKSIIFNFHYINFQAEFTGVSAIYQFVSQQLNGWKKLSDSLSTELQQSINYFTNIQSQLINLANEYINQQGNNLNSYWKGVQNQIIKTDQFPLTYNCPETIFLIDITENFNAQTAQGAFHFLTGRITSNITNNTDYFKGAVLAYEFTLMDQTDLLNRRNKEKSSISKLRSDFQNYLTETDSVVVEHLTNISAKYEEYVKEIDGFKIEKEDLFTNWFNDSKSEFSNFDSTSKTKIEELENTYREKLKLEEPAKYWETRASKLRTQGWIAFVGLLILVCGVAYSLQDLLWKVPEQIYESFFKDDKSAAIRWSIIYVTFISFIAFAVKAVTKVMFSSFHLARDSEERHTLTYFYLSLLKESKVDEKDKLLIMQSLFSRSDTGLLKDDSSPTMPSESITKIFSK